MSDTITKEKRDRLRKHATEWVEMGDYCRIEPETMLGLLDALERAEARADGGLMEELKRANALTEKKEAMVKLLKKELDDADAEIVSLRAEVQTLISDKQKAEAEVARLTAELDWLAGREITVDGFAAPCQCEAEYFHGKKAPCGEKPDEFCSKFNYRGNGKCWTEAARKAVAGEGK